LVDQHHHMLWQSVGLGCQFDPQTVAYFLAYRGTTNAVDLNVILNSRTGHEGFPVRLAAVSTDDVTQASCRGDRLPSLASCRYSRDASQRPLQGIPPDAPFHLPEPALPLS
jgi:hypothetical protein